MTALERLTQAIANLSATIEIAADQLRNPDPATTAKIEELATQAETINTTLTNALAPQE